MPALDSSALTCAEYDEETRVMSLWFRDSGERYDYLDVPAHIYDGLIAASSAGGYFARHVRDRFEVRQGSVRGR